MRRLSTRLPRSWAALAGQASAAAAEVERPAPVPDPLAGAFFDVDNTLMRGASIYHFAPASPRARCSARVTWPG